MHREPARPPQPSARTFALLVVGLILLPAGAPADTNIGGGAVSGVWTAAGSPYHVLGDISIAEGDTLLIEPGVIIDFANNPLLVVYGVLEAVGTEADSIRFTGPGQWSGVAFYSPEATSHMTYCVLEAPGYQQIGILGSCPEFAHCAFRNASNMGVNMWNTAGTVTFAHCSITACENGMQVHDEASVTMTACHIGANGDAGGIDVLADCTLTMIDCSVVGNRNLSEGAGGITFRYGTLVMESCLLQDNRSEDPNIGYGGALTCEGATVQLIDCRFVDNCGELYNLSRGGGAVDLYQSTAVLEGCAFHANATSGSEGLGALNVGPGGSATLDRCTIDANEGGGAVLLASQSSSATITNSIFSNNSTCGIMNQGSLSVHYCDFFNNLMVDVVGAPSGFGNLVGTNPNGDPCDIYGNIFLDPLYVDQPGGDLHLTAASPCIDAGDPAHPDDPDGTPVDQGAYYFHQSSGVGEWPQPARALALEVYPNPASPGASIGFVAPRAGRFRIDVLDLSGRRVAMLADRDLTAGPQTVSWRGCDTRGRALPAGVYLIRVAGDTGPVMRKVTLLR